MLEEASRIAAEEKIASAERGVAEARAAAEAKAKAEIEATKRKKSSTTGSDSSSSSSSSSAPTTAAVVEPLTPKEEEALAARLATMDDVGDRAFEVLRNLGLIDDSTKIDPESPDYDSSRDDEIADGTIYLD